LPQHKPAHCSGPIRAISPGNKESITMCDLMRTIRTAREVVARIQQQVGVPRQSDTVDTFRAGNPDSPVSGISVTMMATLDVMQRAAAAGDNLIITHEPTFFDHVDISGQLPKNDDDPVLMAKPITDHPRPHPLRTGRHGRVYAPAEDIRDGSSNPVRSGP
jgi:hypothetical protein